MGASITYCMVNLQAIASHLSDTPMIMYGTGRWAHFNVKLHFFVLSVFNVDIRRNTYLSLYAQQYSATFWKRVLYTWRSWLVTLTQLFVPLFFTIMALTVIKVIPKATNNPPLLLNLQPFGTNNVVSSSGNNTTASPQTQKLAAVYNKQFLEAGVNNIYLNNESSDESVSEYLVKVGEGSIGDYNNLYMIAASFLQMNNSVNVTALFNDQSYHTPAITLNAIDNTLLQYYVNNSYTLNTINEPLPGSIKDQIYDSLNLDFQGFTIAFNVLFGMAFLSSSFVVFLIGERAVKAKHCQVGAFPSNYKDTMRDISILFCNVDYKFL